MKNHYSAIGRVEGFGNGKKPFSRLRITNLGEQGSSIHVEGGKNEKKNANKDMAETLTSLRGG
jgi:hypothetical protein